MKGGKRILSNKTKATYLNFELKSQYIISLKLFKILLVKEVRKSAPNQLKGNVI